MITIGTLKKQENGYRGTLTTLSVNKAIELRPVETKAEQGPDFRLYAMGREIGAAWSKTSEAGNLYLSVKLDDPTFAAPIFARLIGSDDGEHRLVWSR